MWRFLKMETIFILPHKNTYEYRTNFAMKSIFYCLFVFCCLSVADGECILRLNSSSSAAKEHELLKLLKPLQGHKFTAEDDKYSYSLVICDAIDQKLLPGVGAVQTEKTGSKKNYSLGSYNDTEVVGGTDWVFLTYYGGEKYNEHCEKTNRKSRIMFICDPAQLIGDFQILEERIRQEGESCSYLFEVGTSVVCQKSKQPPDSLSSGSVFCIIVFTAAGIYLLLGFLYQRIVVGAKGLEQIPNYTFWRSFGNLQADGCDYICRCGPRQESHAYRGIDDRIRTDEERDDQLLNM